MDELSVHFQGFEPSKGGIPLYKSLYEQLKTLIQRDVFKAGHQLPASRKLATQLNISRNSVNRAYEMLTDDGYVINKPGAGVFVQNNLDFKPIHQGHETDQSDLMLPPCSDVAQVLFESSKQALKSKNNLVFGFGKPPLDIFPKDIWARLLSRRWRLSASKLSREMDPMGYHALREAILDQLIKTRGIRCTIDQIMITSGSQQAIDLCARVLMNPKDTVLLNDPCYDGIYNLFKANGHPIILADHDPEGLVLDPLLNPNVHINTILSTPSRHFPLGIVLSLKRRLELLELARKKQAWIIEDDYDSELRFDGAPISALQGLDREGRVIYTGTFSRTMFPGLRIGFLVIPNQLVAYFKAMRKIMDGHSSILPQAAMADFISEGYYHRHLRKLNNLLRQRRDFLRFKIKDLDDIPLELFPNDGGLHLCTSFREDRSDIAFADKCHAQGVGVMPLSQFYKGERKQNGLVFNFASFTENEMAKGLEKLKELFVD